MDSSISPFFFLSLLLFSSSAAAFNITKILDQDSEFSTYNNFLTRTRLVDEINRRQTITVLAVDNGAVSALSGRPDDEIKRILSVHVVLDYYDMDKLKNLSKKKSTLLTTLFQSSGLATQQQGFINISVSTSGDIRLGSASPGSGLNADVIKSVAARPYNISVMQISSLIIPTGIDNATKTAGPPKKAPAPAPASKSDAPAPSNESVSPVSSPPVSNADGPSAAGPAADGPVANGPSVAGPSADGVIDKAGSPGPSHDAAGSVATRVGFGTCLGVVMGVACMAVL